MGALIPEPTNSDTDWSNHVIITQHARKDFDSIVLNTSSDTAAPQVKAGSYSVINGAMYSLATTANAPFTGTSSITAGDKFWLTVVPNGTSCTLVATTANPPSYDHDKGGWFYGNNKYIGKCLKTTGGKYYAKRLLKKPGEFSDITIPIPPWNMDLVESKSIKTGLLSTEFYGMRARVFSDAGAWYDFSVGGTLIVSPSGTTGDFVFAARTAAGIFDSTTYDSTSFNRGDLLITIRD